MTKFLGFSNSSNYRSIHFLLVANNFFKLLKIEYISDIIEDDGTFENSPESSFASPDDVKIIEERKHKTDLQKVCGFQSYQQIIEKAISSSSEKHLTLNQSNFFCHFLFL